MPVSTTSQRPSSALPGRRCAPGRRRRRRSRPAARRSARPWRAHRGRWLAVPCRGHAVQAPTRQAAEGLALRQREPGRAEADQRRDAKRKQCSEQQSHGAIAFVKCGAGTISPPRLAAVIRVRDIQRTAGAAPPRSEAEATLPCGSACGGRSARLAGVSRAASARLTSSMVRSTRTRISAPRRVSTYCRRGRIDRTTDRDRGRPGRAGRRLDAGQGTQLDALGAHAP